MEIQEIIGLISQNGFAIGLVIFFMVKLSKVLESLQKLMEELKTKLTFATDDKLGKMHEEILKMAYRKAEDHTGDPSEQ